MEEKKNLEIVSGDGSNLAISQVYDHLNIAKPKSTKEKPTSIVVPKESQKSSNKESNDTEKEKNKEEEN